VSSTPPKPLNRADPLVAFKLELLERAFPAESAVVFGDIWRVDGGYAKRCAELGCPRVLLIDSLETEAWTRARASYPQLDFYKGDFSNASFMASISESFEVGVAFDILLHQAPLLHALHLMLERVSSRFCFAQPMLAEQETPNALIYLPGNSAEDLYPLDEPSADIKVFDQQAVNASHWIWGMTRSLLRSVLAGEGFEISEEREGPRLPNPKWSWWGCIGVRRQTNEQHWSRVRPTPGFFAE
jgi:hypothetical protein